MQTRKPISLVFLICLILGGVVSSSPVGIGTAYADTEDVKIAFSNEVDKTSFLFYTWTPAPGVVDHYNVYVSVNGGPFEMVGRTLDSTPAYTLENVQEGVTYRLRIQAVDTYGNIGALSEVSAPITADDPTIVSTTLNPDMATTQTEQNEQARERLMTSHAPPLQDATLLYQLAVAEFNFGNTVEARARLRQAHALIERSQSTIQQDMKSFAELHIDGAYSFLPVSRDGWRLQPKGRTSQDVSRQRIYRLDTGSVYKMKLEPTKSDSKPLIVIPIGLLVVWVFAR